MKKTMLLILLISFLSETNAQKSKKQDDYIWNLSTLYASDTEWNKDVSYIQTNTPKIKELENIAINSADDLLMILNRVSDLRGRAAKLIIYGLALENLNTKSEEAKSRLEIASKLEGDVETAVSFINHDIAKISINLIEKWYAQNPDLKIHVKRINRIISEAPYRLHKETEKVLKSLNRIKSQSGETYQAIIESDLNWPSVTLSDGAIVTITLRKYLSLRRRSNSKDRAIISKAFLNYLSTYSEVFKIQLSKRIDSDFQLAKLKGFPTGPDADFFLADGFPIGTAKTMREAAFKNRKTLQRFIKVQTKLNGFLQANYADIYFKGQRIEKPFTIAESVEIVLKGTEFLGKEYQKKLIEVLNDSTMHLANLKNKRYMWALYPPVGGAKPYIIMTYNESFLSSNVFMRAVIANLVQHHYKPDTRDDPAVYGNGIVYVGSLMHYDYLIKNATSKDEKLFYLVEETKRLWNSFFKYAIYASFENEIEKRLKANEPPQASEISQIYYNLIKQFFGDDVIIPEEFKYEWMTIAQPFRTYEHQYWPVAMSAACAILERIDEDTIKDLLIGKTKADSDRSHQILLTAGIPMNTIESYQPLMNRMNKLLDAIEKEMMY
jgi:oligoendopeptidase F